MTTQAHQKQVDQNISALAAHFFTQVLQLEKAMCISLNRVECITTSNDGRVLTINLSREQLSSQKSKGSNMSNETAVAEAAAPKKTVKKL